MKRLKCSDCPSIFVNTKDVEFIWLDWGPTGRLLHKILDQAIQIVYFARS